MLYTQLIRENPFYYFAFDRAHLTKLRLIAGNHSTARWSLRKYQYTQTAREFDGFSTKTPFVSMWLFIDRLLWMYVYFIDNTPSRIYIYIYWSRNSHKYTQTPKFINAKRCVCKEYELTIIGRVEKKEETNATDNYRIQPDTNRYSVDDCEACSTNSIRFCIEHRARQSYRFPNAFRIQSKPGNLFSTLKDTPRSKKKSKQHVWIAYKIKRL